MKGRIFLIHWNATQAEEYAQALRAQGWEVATESQDGARAGKALLANPPDVVIIYLTRLPSHGRETAHALRSHKAGRALPIVFVGGEGEGLEKTRWKVPDAIYTVPAQLTEVLAGLVRLDRGDIGWQHPE